jgi:hypothetical protein
MIIISQLPVSKWYDYITEPTRFAFNSLGSECTGSGIVQYTGDVLNTYFDASDLEAELGY